LAVKEEFGNEIRRGRSKEIFNGFDELGEFVTQGEGG